MRYWIQWLGMYGLLLMVSPLLLASVYEGYLGDDHIVLEISKEMNKTYSGRYFYKKYLNDIELSGTLDQLNEYVSDVGKDRVIKATWSGKLSKQSFKGVWISSDNKQPLSFELSRINQAGVPILDKALSDLMLAGDLTAYDFFKMQRPLKKGKEIVIGKVGYQMISDPITKAYYPLLTRHPNQAVMDKINPLLRVKLWDIILQNNGCDSVPTISVNYLSEKILDLNHSGSIDCGGAHPSHFNYPETYDLVKQQEMNWGDYFDVYHVEDDETLVWDKHFLALIVSKLDDLSLVEESANELDEPCKDLTTSSMFSLGIHLKRQHYITFAIIRAPHAVSICEGDIVDIGIDEMKPWLKVGVPSLF